MRPTQTIKIFGNVSMPFGTLAIHDLSIPIELKLTTSVFCIDFTNSVAV